MAATLDQLIVAQRELLADRIVAVMDAAQMVLSVRYLLCSGKTPSP